MKRLAGILLSVLTALSPALAQSQETEEQAAAACPDYTATQAHVLAELTPSGLNNISDWGARNSLKAVEIAAPRIKLQPLTVGPVADDCTPAKTAAMTTADVWSSCFGMPLGEVKGPAKAQITDWEKPVPASFTFSNTKFTNLKFGGSSVTGCTATSCNVSLTLDQVSLNSDVSSGALFPPKGKTSQTLFSAKGIEATAKSTPANPIVLTATVNINSKNGLNQLLQIDPASVKLSLSGQNMHLDLANSPAEDARIQREMALSLYASLKDKFKLASAATDEAKMAVVKNLPASVVNSVEFSKAASNAYVKAITPRFDSAKSAELFETGRSVVATLLKNQAFNQLLKESVITKILPKVSTSINEKVAGKLPLVNKYYDQVVPIARLQNSVDLKLMTDQIKTQQANLTGLQGSIGSTTDALSLIRSLNNEIGRVHGFSKTIADMTDQTDLVPLLTGLIPTWQALDAKIAAALAAPGLSSDMQRALSSMKASADTTLETLTAELDKAKLTTGPSENLLLRLTSADADKFTQTLRAGVVVCTTCGHPQITPGAPPTVGDFKVVKDYDLALRVRTDLINAYIATMYHEHDMDLCVAGKKANDSDCDQFHFFGGPPTVSASNHGLVLNIPKISYNGSITACGPVGVSVGASSDHKHITIVPKAEDLSFCRNDTSFWKSVVSWFETVTLILPIGETAALQIFQDEILSAMGTPQAPVPDTVQVQSVTADSGGVTLYAKFTSPDMTLAELQSMADDIVESASTVSDDPDVEKVKNQPAPK